jgi:hypothetical protein
MTETTVPTATRLAAAGLRAVDRYVDFWNAATPDVQRRVADETFVADVCSHQLLGVMLGVEQLMRFRDEFAKRVPDFEFRARKEPDAHRDRARLQWEIVVGDERIAAGTDVLVLEEDGRIASVTGFVDQFPAGFDLDAHH